MYVFKLQPSWSWYERKIDPVTILWLKVSGWWCLLLGGLRGNCCPFMSISTCSLSPWRRKFPAEHLFPKHVSRFFQLGKHIEELARRGSNPGMGSIQLLGTKLSHPQVLERQHPGNPVHQLEWERLFYGRAPSFLGVRDLSLKWFLIELESLKTHLAIPLQRQTPKDHRFRCQIRNLLPVTWTRWNGTPWGFFWAENAPVWNIQPTVNILSGSLVCELLSTACYRFFQRHSWIPSNPGRQDWTHWWGTFLWSKPALGKSLPQSNRTVEQNTHSVKQR